MCITPFTISKCASITVRDIEPKSKQRELLYFFFSTFILSAHSALLALLLLLLLCVLAAAATRSPLPPASGRSRIRDKKYLRGDCGGSDRWHALQKLRWDSIRNHILYYIRLSFCGCLFIVTDMALSELRPPEVHKPERRENKKKMNK